MRRLEPTARQLGLALALILTCGHARPTIAEESPMPSLRTSLVATGTVLAISFLDEDSRDFFARNRSLSSDLIADQVRVLAEPRVSVVIPLAWLGVGLATRDPEITAAGARVSASVALTGMVVRGLKFGVGRDRPFQGDGPRSFDAFSNQTSFPSGHSAISFALAESFAHEGGHRGLTALCYGLASLTTWSRLNDEVHWLSDTVAGALLGIGGARMVQAAFARWDGGTFGVLPFADGTALAWSRTF